MARYSLDGCNDTFSVCMRTTHSAKRAARPRTRAARLARHCTPWAALLGICAYLLLGCGHSAPKAAAVSCFDGSTPRVAEVPAHSLDALRASVLRVLPQRVGRLYEEGTARASYVWTDEDPAPPPVSARALRPAGYEMRWVAPNSDDVRATALLFPTAKQARRFMALAASARCRTHGFQGISARPPLSRNVAWINPHGVAEADVYLLRGRRVYRVGDLPASQRSDQPAGTDLSRSFFTVDALACLLPGAHCLQTSRNVPA
jgi:hypothetical protein